MSALLDALALTCGVALLGELLVRHYVVPMLIRRRTRRYQNIEGGR